MTSEKRKEYNRQWRLKNKDKVKEYNLKHKDQIITGSSKYKESHGKATQKYHKQRKQSDPLFKLKCNLSSLISNSINNKGYIKSSRSAEVLGCTWDEFKQYIESQFEPWMNWGNYGCKSPSGPDTTWDLDHIIPVSSAVNEDDIKRLNHYTNFQPLCSYQNRFIKRDRVM